MYTTQRLLTPLCADSYILMSFESLSAQMKRRSLTWRPRLEASSKDFHVWWPFSQTKYASWLFYSNSPSSSANQISTTVQYLP